ncbi:MAG: hypothetical protein JWN73_724 [Betaproteobacteria bacterium]|nr:hypothetical protein [Betaproteobacteria bacterium]
MTTQKINSPTEAISGAVNDVKSSFGNVAQSLAGAFDKRKSAAIDQIDAGREAVTGYARENPMRTVGLAALVGIALGIVFFRR